MKTIRKSISVTIQLLCVIACVHAQKLPNKQEVSLRAPANIKIDGKMNEWGDKLQAYNKAILVNYLVANDDENLYLVVECDNTRIINKIISGAITFTVNNQGAKNDKKSPAVTFPLLSFAAGTAIRNSFTETTSSTDALLKSDNNWLNTDAKQIKFSDISEITDTLTGTHTERKKEFGLYPLFAEPGYYIAKNNTSGIQAAASFEGQWKYVYELAIPLKYLKLSAGKKFSYNIRLNGPMYNTKKPTAGYPVRFLFRDGKAEPIDQDITSTTDMWGEYTLAH